ncbi:MAG: hypothetical protein GY715_20275 [Planctomycetes bacterium]|nr:hypothetical protein [Planctomycetota bacterium]
MRGPRLIIAAMLVAAASVSPCRGDALVVTRAMTAPTIAEIFIEPGTVRVELEIGVDDLEGFRNLLPDELYERLGHDPSPLAVRFERFFTEDLVLRADDGDPIAGTVRQVVPRYRVRRDEITGDPVPGAEDEGEPVVFAEIDYALDGSPRALSLAPPTTDAGRAAASIGFMTYHGGVPINDYRYLAQEETIDLDWDDPWYSSFRNRNLRRRYNAPLSVFLYVDHFEVRKEIIVRPKDLQHWVDLGLAGATEIAAADQGALKQTVADFLVERGEVTIDGQRVEPALDRIHFIRRTLKTTGVIEPPEDLPIVSATLGVIFSYPITALPDEVTMDWDLFSERIPAVPAVATDEAGGLPSTLTADDPVLVWKNFLTNPSSAALVEVDPPPAPPRLGVPIASLLCGLLAVTLVVRAFGADRGLTRTTAAVILLAAVAAFVLRPFGRVSVPNPLRRTATVAPSEADGVVTALLRNVYRAFDHRDEGVIYDTLARSASGELLSSIYLETQRALELENQGGARAKVADVELVTSSVDGMDGETGFRSTCTWNVTGSVGHWGHLHQRRNQYEAVFTVRPVDGTWKITDLELLSEQRL